MIDLDFKRKINLCSYRKTEKLGRQHLPVCSHPGHNGLCGYHANSYLFGCKFAREAGSERKDL